MLLLPSVILVEGAAVDQVVSGGFCFFSLVARPGQFLLTRWCGQLYCTLCVKVKWGFFFSEVCLLSKTESKIRDTGYMSSEAHPNFKDTA